MAGINYLLMNNKINNKSIYKVTKVHSEMIRYITGCVNVSIVNGINN